MSLPYSAIALDASWSLKLADPLDLCVEVSERILHHCDNRLDFLNHAEK
jgi:hypothetical protein